MLWLHYRLEVVQIGCEHLMLVVRFRALWGKGWIKVGREGGWSCYCGDMIFTYMFSASVNALILMSKLA